MNYKQIVMEPRKKIALVAHDNKKQDLFEWVKFNRDLLSRHVLYATGTTGAYHALRSPNAEHPAIGSLNPNTAPTASFSRPNRSRR